MAVKSLKRSSVKSTQKANAMATGYTFQDYELIESVFLASPAASVTFSNLNQYATEYSHLQIRAVARSGSINANCHLRFNGVSTNSYSFHSLYGTGSSVASEGYANTDKIFQICNMPPSTNHFAGSVADILDAFSSTKNKTVRRLGGVSGGDGIFGVSLISGAFFSMSPTSSLTIIGDVNIGAGSRFSLYGIR
jgi:hypothetical protein